MKIHAQATDFWARIGGAFLLFCFVGLITGVDDLVIPFKPPYTVIHPGEALFWLGIVLLVTPGALLLGYGFRASLSRAIARTREAIGAVNTRDRKLMLGAVGVIVAVVAQIGNEVVLAGYPITDDEWAARFGGQALAHGKVLVDIPGSLDAFPKLFLYVRGHAVGSVDFLGPQLYWAFAEATGSGHWIFALSAAMPVVCIAYVLTKRLSPAWGAVGGLVAFVSPMAFALSLTSHAHIHSRALIALALALHVWTAETWSAKRAASVGLAIGGAILCRPAEAMAILLPFAVIETRAAFAEGGARRTAMLASFGALLVPIAIMFAHAHAVTGGWMIPRLSEGAVSIPWTSVPLWSRFGSNGAYNLLRLAVWFGGPVGIVLAGVGVLRDRFTVGLGLGVFMIVFVVGLTHRDYGLHAVGPIHHSECVVPLTILAVHGFKNLVDRARGLGLDGDAVAGAVLTALAVGGLTMAGVQSGALYEQSRPQRDIYEAIEERVPQAGRPAILLAPKFASLWLRHKVYGQRGSWVYEWRRPSPLFDEPITILIDYPGAVGSARSAWPDRPIYRLTPDGVVERVSDDEPDVAPGWMPSPLGPDLLAPAWVRIPGSDPEDGAGGAGGDDHRDDGTSDDGPREDRPRDGAPTRAPASARAPTAVSDLEPVAQETFGDARGALVQCLRDERAARPGVAGKLPVTVRVDANGLVAEVRFGDSTVRSAAFDDCAEQAMLTLVFPAVLSRHELSITYDLR